MKNNLRKILEHVMDYMLLFASGSLGLSSMIYSFQSPPHANWFSRFAMSLILMGLWLIQSRLKIER